jgi:hypothetical protein
MTPSLNAGGRKPNRRGGGKRIPGGRGFGVVPRDDNGYPRSDTRWEFTPLGYIYVLNILPVGLLLAKIFT